MVAIAIANQKGGVGKTTITLGLAEVAMANGLKVLVVDCDPQANASSGLGIPAENNHLTLAEILDDEVLLNSENFDEYVHSSPWTDSKMKETQGGSIDVICAHPRLTNVESHLASDPIGACDRLDIAISEIAHDYDLILFDCPPSVGLLTINALFASDKVIVVSAPSAWSSDGVESFTRNVDRISKRRDGKPSVAGIIVNNVGRTRDGRFWESEIIERHKENVVSISSRAAIAEASAMSSPLMDLGARAGAKEAKQEFNEVFLKLIGLTADAKKMPESKLGQLKSTEVIPAKSIAAAI